MGKPGIILHPISCLVERQESYRLTCFQCGCCCSLVEKMILGKSFQNVPHDFQYFGSVADSSECFVYSVPEPLRSASLERHLQSAWIWSHISAQELGAAQWFPAVASSAGEDASLESSLLTDLPLENIPPLEEIHYFLLFQGDAVKAVCINLCAVKLN